MNVIELHNVCRKVSPKFQLDCISLIIEQGEFVILKGDNGHGKSTLLNLILGFDKPDSGEVKLNGFSPQDYKSKNRVGTVLQTVKPPEEIKVKEFVDLWRSYYPNPLCAEEILDKVNLKGKHDNFFGNLSGGEKQRLYFALALANNPILLILDELTQQVDPEGKQGFWEQIRQCREKGVTILMVTNESSDRENIEALGTRSITIKWNENDGKSKIVADETIINKRSTVGTSGEDPPFKVEPQTLISMLLRQTWIEFIKISRYPTFLLGVFLFPCLVVFLQPMPGLDKKVELLFFAGISLLTFAIERIGNIVATERSEGWLKLLRVSPLPPTVYFAAKIIVTLVILVVNLLLIIFLGVRKIGIEENFGRWLIIFSSLIIGIIPFIILGLALGYLFKPKSVNIITGLSIPVALFTCGLPLTAPKYVQDLIPFSPFYNYSQLVQWSAGISSYDKHGFLHILWLLWAGFIFAFVAVWAYQQDKVVQR